MKISPGMRTFAAFVFAAVFLLVGFGLAVAFPVAGVVAFPAYATAVVGIFWGVVGKHSVESLATGTGIAGAKAALMTPTKPHEVPHDPP